MTLNRPLNGTPIAPRPSLVILLLALACSASDVLAPPPGTATTVTVVPATLSVAVDSTGLLVAVLTDSSGNPVSAAVTWSTSDTSKATVTPKGTDSCQVRGVATGSAVITASSGGHMGTATVTVTSTTPPAGGVATVTVVPNSATVYVGSTQQLVAVLTDANGNPVTGSVTWSSSDTTAATVSDSGLVKGVASGSATMTAASGGKSGTASITVTSPPPVDSTEPVYNSSTDHLLYQQNFDGPEYASASAAYAYVVTNGNTGFMPAFPGSPPAQDPGDNTITGRGGSGHALREDYIGSSWVAGTQESHNWRLRHGPTSDYTKPLYITVWIRWIPNGGSFPSTLEIKNIQLWHSTGRQEITLSWDKRYYGPYRDAPQETSAAPCGLAHAVGIYARFWDDPASSSDPYSGMQPVGPCLNNLVNGWHRWTLAYKSHASSGNKDGMQMVWIDGVKIMDVRTAMIGVWPTGGTWTWCSQTDVNRLDTGSNGAVSDVSFAGPVTGWPGTTFSIDWDDFIMWQP